MFLLTWQPSIPISYRTLSRVLNTSFLPEEYHILRHFWSMALPILHSQGRAYMSIAGSWGKHSACCSHLYLFTQLSSPSFKQTTLAQKSEMEIKLGGFLKTAVQYPAS